jgi:hypothetical protein
MCLLRTTPNQTTVWISRPPLQLLLLLLLLLLLGGGALPAALGLKMNARNRAKAVTRRAEASTVCVIVYVPRASVQILHQE